MKSDTVDSFAGTCRVERHEIWYWILHFIQQFFFTFTVQSCKLLISVNDHSETEGKRLYSNVNHLRELKHFGSVILNLF